MPCLGVAVRRPRWSDSRSGCVSGGRDLGEGRGGMGRRREGGGGRGSFELNLRAGSNHALKMRALLSEGHCLFL